MQEETVLYSPTAKQFCVLNETAAFIWGMLDVPRTATEISARICTEFADVEIEVASEDVRTALEQLVELELVSVN